jgi:hypothetical protein
MRRGRMKTRVAEKAEQHPRLTKDFYPRLQFTPLQSGLEDWAAGSVERGGLLAAATLKTSGLTRWPAGLTSFYATFCFQFN